MGSRPWMLRRELWTWSSTQIRSRRTLARYRENWKWGALLTIFEILQIKTGRLLLRDFGLSTAENNKTYSSAILLPRESWRPHTKITNSNNQITLRLKTSATAQTTPTQSQEVRTWRLRNTIRFHICIPLEYTMPQRPHQRQAPNDVTKPACKGISNNYRKWLADLTTDLASAMAQKWSEVLAILSKSSLRRCSHKSYEFQLMETDP